MKNMMKGAVLAATVAGLFLSGQVMAETSSTTGKVKCEGANACKGKSACKTSANACAGQNGCAGKGWIYTKDEAECTAKKGKVVK
ncbi:MAG: hypothetical protein HY465_00530 [Deltaproteobacteria bacterium]|nr:hypothetical protein [Deltaproteobacteria bacterium]